MITDHAELQQVLFDEKARLERELENLVIGSSESLGYGNHMADDATQAFDQAANLALQRGLGDTLEKVRAALQRFEDGTYGTCQRCGKPIDLARLEALPYATLCIRCQHRSEYR